MKHSVMKPHKRLNFIVILALSVSLCLLPVLVHASESGILSTITGGMTAQIQAIDDGSGKYLLKSDSFYCLRADGTVTTSPEVHYFDHYRIGTTLLDGWYYHDNEGRFRSADDHLIYISNVTGSRPDGETITFDGFYMAGNMGKLTAAPQVRYLEEETSNGHTFDGYYYFDEYGRLSTENTFRTLNQECGDRVFDGDYYFGGPDGALSTEAGVTPDGFNIDMDGKIVDEIGMDVLENVLKKEIEDYQGTWSIYVEDLGTGETIVINNQAITSASLIKLFVMQYIYSIINELAPEEAQRTQIDTLLWNMITVSDNEAFNTLVATIGDNSSDFVSGAKIINEYLKEEGYENTEVMHTLHPSTFANTSIDNKNNVTCVEDCGKLLSAVYRGECINKDCSDAMLNLLENQTTLYKIPAGLPAGIRSASKSGENVGLQHDSAIVYGEKTDYVVCIMSDTDSEITGGDRVKYLSSLIYKYMNI